MLFEIVNLYPIHQDLSLEKKAFRLGSWIDPSFQIQPFSDSPK